MSRRLLFAAAAAALLSPAAPAMAGAAAAPWSAAPWSAAKAFPADPTNRLPLQPARRLEFDTDEGTWISLDVSPDGRTLAFDLLGDIYVMPASGGEAKAITRGLPFDSQPAFSRNGRWIAFISDRSGADNLWIMHPDGSGLKALSTSAGVTSFVSPAWSADGRSVYVSTYRPDQTAYELWRYDLAGGAPVRITAAKSGPAQSKETYLSALGAVASPDGRYLYDAERTRGFDEDMTLPIWSVVRRELSTGDAKPLVSAPKAKAAGTASPMDEETEASAQGSAMRPALSPDGRLLAYATRYRGETGLRLRDLTTGQDRWLAYPVQHDAQEALESRDTVPRYAFTPDGRAVLAAYGGHFHRIAVADGRDTVIPFRAHVALDLGPDLHQDLREETGPVRARLIQDPVPSPDGRTLAFSAMGQIYLMPLDGRSRPRRLTTGAAPEYQPSWSADGRTVLYVTWTAQDAGAIWAALTDRSGPPRRLTAPGGFYYTHPVFTPDGAQVLAERSSSYTRLHTYMEYGPHRDAELVSLPASGGAERTVLAGSMGGRPQFVTGDLGHVFLNIDDGLDAVDLNTGARRRVITATGPGFYFVEGRVPVDQLEISPDGRWVLAQIVQQLHLLAVPRAADARTPIDVDSPTVAHRKLTNVGADFLGWSDGGRSLDWALGSTFYRRPLASIVPDAPGPAPSTGERPAPRHAGVEAFQADVELPRDTPEGVIALRGATAITEDRGKVVADADILVRDGRIAAIGPRGAVAIPARTKVLDLAGRYVMPGLIDTHDHWAEVRREVFDLSDWGFKADLAYGKTTGLDPSALSIDMLAYQDLLEAGLMTGPRVHSVATAVFSFNEFHSPQEVEDVLSRYCVFYRTRNLKEYRTGDRQVRQWVVEAAHKLGMQPTTEGALDMKLDLTQIMDGYPGNEHSLSGFPLYGDVLQLMAATRVSYTLTLQISHNGPPAQNFYIERDHPVADPKMNRFWPPYALQQKASRRRWYDLSEYVFPKVAASAGRLQAQGGLLGVGSHGEVPGPGQVWETEAYASGMGAEAALQAATIGSAETIGRKAELGSLEPGKFADLLILDRDPRADTDVLRTHLRQVMRGGRLYDAASLDQLWPTPRRQPAPWFAADRPPQDVQSP